MLIQLLYVFPTVRVGITRERGDVCVTYVIRAGLMETEKYTNVRGPGKSQGRVGERACKRKRTGPKCGHKRTGSPGVITGPGDNERKYGVETGALGTKIDDSGHKCSGSSEVIEDLRSNRERVDSGNSSL